MAGLFELGQVVVTNGAVEAIVQAQELLNAPTIYLNRHVAGDYGDVDDQTWLRNAQAIVAGGRIASAYSLSDGTKIWIVTASDRSKTVIMLPDEHQDFLPP